MTDRKRKVHGDTEISLNSVAKYMKTSGSLSLLPFELFLRIIRNLDSSSVLDCRTVCKRWRDIIDEDVLFWKKFAEEHGISTCGLPERLEENSAFIVDAIQARLRTLRLYNKSTAMIKTTSRLVGIEKDEGVLIHLKGQLLFYRLHGLRLNQFLNILENEDVNVDDYNQDLVFRLDYDQPIVDWCSSDNQIHIFNGDTIDSWEFGSPLKKLSTEILHKSELVAQKCLSFHLLPKNIKIVKLAGWNRSCSGVSISFKTETNSLERVFIASRGDKTCFFHVDESLNAAELCTLNYSLRDCGIHFIKGPTDKSVIVYMGHIVEQGDQIDLEVRSFLVAVTPKQTVDVVNKSILKLSCDSLDNEIVSIGKTFIVVFDRERKRLRYYLRPKNEENDVLKIAFEVNVSEACDPTQCELRRVKFLFQDDVNEGLFGSAGVVSLYRCQRRFFSDVFYVHCT